MTDPHEGIRLHDVEIDEIQIKDNKILSRREVNLAKCPIPYCQIAGCRVLIYPDEADDRFGKFIIIPDTSKEAMKASVGTIVQVGGGYASDHEHDPKWFRDNCPYKPGDKVLWSRYDREAIKCYVHREWWTEEEIAEMQKFKREHKVTFQLVELGRIIALSTAGEREPIVEG